MTALSDGQLDRLRSLVDWPDTTGTRYDLVEKIAVGGMGSVYKAHDRALDRTVAFKVLTVSDEAGSLAARMLNEAKIVARLEHPSIVPIHDVGALPDGRVFYAMKFVEGTTLEAYRARDASLPDLLRAFQRICEGVDFAHSRGVIHRDLKPSNVMVGGFGEVLVMDWGVAAVRGHAGVDKRIPSDQSGTQTESSQSKTVDGTIVGTPAYMSPEQAEGRITDSDWRTDIYGLGAILYHILTGQAPVSGGSADDITSRVVAGDIRPVREVLPTVPKRLEAICMKALMRNPAERYPDAKSMSKDISRYLDGEPVSAYRESILEKAGRWVNRNRFIVWMVLAYIVFRFLVFFWRGI